MIYLATPYSSNQPEVQESRYDEACRITGMLMSRYNHVVFSPIVHCHVIAKQHNLPTDHLFWKRYDTEMIKRCDALMIFMMEGWDVSHGVGEEKKLAEEMKKDILFARWSDCGTMEGMNIEFSWSPDKGFMPLQPLRHS